jgi:hypothetical protein
MQILKREIHIPELMNIEVSELMDYPPRLFIYGQLQEDAVSAEIEVDGLDVECHFNLIPGEHFSAQLWQFPQFTLIAWRSVQLWQFPQFMLIAWRSLSIQFPQFTLIAWRSLTTSMRNLAMSIISMNSYHPIYNLADYFKPCTFKFVMQLLVACPTSYPTYGKGWSKWWVLCRHFMPRL